MGTTGNRWVAGSSSKTAFLPADIFCGILTCTIKVIVWTSLEHFLNSLSIQRCFPSLIFKTRNFSENGSEKRITFTSIIRKVHRDWLMSSKSSRQQKRGKGKKSLALNFAMKFPSTHCITYFFRALWSSPGGNWAHSQCVGGGLLFHCRAGSSPPPAQPPSGGAGSPAPPNVAAAAPWALVARESGPRHQRLTHLWWGDANSAAGR